MQNPNLISLNAVRVFATVAEYGSIKLAATKIGVTPGAVSRQILNLETVMGLQLFHRNNNAIRLTDTGASFLQNALPALHNLKRAIETTMNDQRDIVVQLPTTLATRWLIPQLAEFKKHWPDVIVRIETYAGTGLPLGSPADIMIAYHPISQIPEDAEILLEDRCRPFLSPHLLECVESPFDLSGIPALQCTTGNWDWETWLKEAGKEDLQLCYSGYFDLDDAALRAAISGLGMVLSSDFMIEDDLIAGRLCELPEANEVLLGKYALHFRQPINKNTDTFAKWLKRIS